MQRWIRIIPNSSVHFFMSKMYDLHLSLRASRGAARVVQQCRAIVQRQPMYSLPYMQMNYTMSYRTRILGGVELCRFCGAGLALSFVNTATKLSHCCWSTRCSRPWARAWDRASLNVPQRPVAIAPLGSWAGILKTSKRAREHVTSDVGGRGRGYTCNTSRAHLVTMSNVCV